MRRSLIQLATALILLICLWGHVAELFDQWDHTLHTGNDLEYSSVIVVIVAGAAIVAARNVPSLLWRRSDRSVLVSSVIGAVQSSLAISVLLTPSPPPAPLRI